MKYWLITYGCQINKSDSERIATVLENVGYKPASRIEEANLIVVNMCSVRQSATDRVYGLLPKFQKLKIKNQSTQNRLSARPSTKENLLCSGQKLKIILTGCVLGKDKKKFAEKFDYILNIKDLAKLPKILLNFPTLIMDDRPLLETVDYLKIQPKYSFSGLVPIMTGCNNFCAFCVVPYTRGREISRPADEIIYEVKNLVKRGVKEIWLLGQNVNSYNNEQRTKNNEQEIDFPKLLRMVNDVPGKFWIRFTSSHPKDFSDELINVMAKCEKVTEYLNLPIQAGDDKILKKMNRPYTVAKYKKLVKKIRKKIPNITLSTDVIIGFPGETKKQFENTIKLFKEIKFDMAYIAKYSPRPGTAAAKLKDNVSSEEKKRREKVLTEILKETALKKNKKYIGKIFEVLAVEYKKGFLTGKSFHYKTVKFEREKNLIGKFVKVKITDALPWGLKGQII